MNMELVSNSGRLHRVRSSSSGNQIRDSKLRAGILESFKCANHVDVLSANISCLLGQEVEVKGLPLVREVSDQAGEWTPLDQIPGRRAL